MNSLTGKSSSMLILYYKPTCVFCRSVLATIDRLEIEVDLRDVTADPAHSDALLELGVKRQTPHLVDEEKNFSSYESDAIIKHLQSVYGKPVASSFTRPRIHVGGSVCESCEG